MGRAEVHGFLKQGNGWDSRDMVGEDDEHGLKIFRYGNEMAVDGCIGQW